MLLHDDDFEQQHNNNNILMDFKVSTSQQDLVDRYNNCNYQRRLDDLLTRGIIPSGRGSNSNHADDGYGCGNDSEHDDSMENMSVLSFLHTNGLLSNNNGSVSSSTAPSIQTIESCCSGTYEDIHAYTLYDRYFQRSKRPYTTFDADGDADIQYLVKIFRHFDPTNTPHLHPRYDCSELRLRQATMSNFCILHQYMSSPEFTIELLKSTKYDHVVNAIVSYILAWNDVSIAEYISMYPDHGGFLMNIMEFRRLDAGAYVYSLNGVPFIKTAFKMLKLYFRPEKVSRKYFDWMVLIDHTFIEHLRRVYDLILNDAFDYTSIALLLESEMAIPYVLPNFNIPNLMRNKTLKFISGQACCCKTTILNALQEMGWRKFSRGDVGTFGGKATNPAAIGNLHAALNTVLNMPDVIGDRGCIDNVIWSFIMPECNAGNADDFVQNMLSFLNSNFNEPSIAQYIMQKGVIFIDPYVELNRQRQLRRCEDGDAHRARIKMYPIAQFMMYYTCARLFGWKIVCVPYTMDKQFDSALYNLNVLEISNFFGSPMPSSDLMDSSVERFDKPANRYIINNTYPKSVGIFK